MILNIDTLSDATGWVVNSPSTITEIEFSKYIAGLRNTKSLMIKFDSADTTRTATKNLTPVDVTNYDTLVFHIWSQNYGFNKNYINIDSMANEGDFSYKIQINGTDEYYIPVFDKFHEVEIGIEEVTEINQILITPLHTATDFIIISNMLVEKEEIPIDILEAVKNHVDYYMEQVIDDGILLTSSFSGTTGDNTISLTYPNYLSRYGVIKIVEGANTETHQIDDNDGLTFRLHDTFDGSALLNTYTTASVYLTFPSMITPGQYDVRLPGMSIWGITPEPVLRGAKLDTLRDTFKTTDKSSKEWIEGQILNYSILIDCEARSGQLIEYMTRAVRRFIAQEILWINGRRHDIYFTGAPVELQGATGIDYIPKVQYSLDVEVKETINDRRAVPATTTINQTIDII